MPSYIPLTVPIPPLSPLTNITPFTYRDGATYLEVLEGMRTYINDYLVAFINDNLGGLNDQWNEQMQLLIAYVDAAILEMSSQVEDAEAAKTAAELAKTEAEAASAAAEAFAGVAGEATDEGMTLVFENLTTNFRIALDAAYASKATETTVTSGRLSVATLDARFADKADVDDLDAALETVDSLVEELSGQDINVKFGNINKEPFEYLHAGLRNLTQDTRVVILGSSNANGGFTTEPEMGTYARLGYRSGAGELEVLDDVVSDVSADGMKWWQGSEGNTTSINYFPSGRKTALNHVEPHYVIHQIGENDYFYGTSVATYKANMIAACEYIEGVNSSVVNVLVHGHGRKDVTSPVAPWSAYRTALEEVAALNPDNRFFIDTSDFFLPLGIMTDDRADLMMDDVHLNDAGHKFLANIVGANLGIPSESDFATTQVYTYPIPATATYSTEGAELAAIYFAPATYPREFKVEGSLWLNFSNAAGYLSIGAVVAGPDTLDSIAISAGVVGVQSMQLSASLYIPPNIAGRVAIFLWPNGGTSGNVNVQGPGGGLSRAKGTLYPI